MSKTFLKIISVLSLLLPAAASADVNVAVIAPKAGEYKSFGDEIISGVRIAVEDINARGGLNGEKINLITVDDQCDDRLAVSTAQMMAVNTSPKDKMSLVIGPYCDNAFDEVAAIYAKANIFQIIPTTISAREATKNHKGLVKMVGYKDRQGKDFYNYYKNNFADKRVARRAMPTSCARSVLKPIIRTTAVWLTPFSKTISIWPIFWASRAALPNCPKN